MTDYQIYSVNFEPGAVIITFGTDSDVRVEGMVSVGRQVQFSLDHPDYAEDMELIQRQIVKALRSVLEDWEASDVYVPQVDDVDDDEFGSRRHN